MNVEDKDILHGEVTQWDGNAREMYVWDGNISQSEVVKRKVIYILPKHTVDFQL